MAQEPPGGLTATLRLAEYQRNPKGVPEEALRHRDPGLRREATRALAQTRDDAAVDRLLTKLADEDDLVVAWAAYGLGLACSGREGEIVPALLARSASWALVPVTRTTPVQKFVPSLPVALADALARCGTLDAARTLRSWLETGWSDVASLALGRLAIAHGGLDDPTLVALLELAGRDAAPVSEALVPLARVHDLDDPAAARLAEVGAKAVGGGGRQKTLALGALAKATPAGAATLAGVLVDEESTFSDRSAAARALGTMGAVGQKALHEAIGSLAKAFDTEKIRAGHGAPVLAALRAAEPPVRASAEAFAALARLELGDADPPTRRRAVAIRCAAATVLAGAASASRALVECDPEGGRAGALAAVGVLNREAITGARYQRWLTFARAKDPAVQRAALELLIEHSEISDISDVLADALKAEAFGVVAAAARVLIARSKKTSGTGPEPLDQKIGRALNAALDRDYPPDQIEPRGLLLRAAAALELLSAKPKAEAMCRSDNSALRRHALAALREFGQGGKPCEPSNTTSKKAPEVGALRTGPKTLTFVTDAGRLGMTLDPTLAPAAVARIVDLARRGFYDGMGIHRVVPGFVVQLGDPTGDGYGTSGDEPVPSETAPIPFDALFVGLAQSGADTGSSQIFVALSPEPLLGGDYPLLGWADPDWHMVAEGDVIQRVEIKP